MKLCPKGLAAVERERLRRAALNEPADNPRTLGLKASQVIQDRRAHAHFMNNHLSRCKECSR